MQSNKVSIAAMLVVTLSGCATTGSNPVDPWESWNRNVYSFNQRVDENVIKPIAKGYDWVMPAFASQAIGNFFRNIDDIGVVINDLLQGKFAQTGDDAARFLLNSSVGLGGLIDVASASNLPKHKEDFDQTLAVWGVPSGPYLMLPLFGPGSPRGIGGLIADSAMNPINYVTGPFAPIGLKSLNIVDTRANNLAAGETAKEAALDHYEFMRDSYLSQRKYLILDGKEEKTDEFFDVDKALDENLKEKK
jgi:phospholipid-binding lipoprotein MlaA